MKIQYSQTEIEIEGKSVFLAGPTPRSEDVLGWRDGAIKAFKELNFNGTILIPELEGGWNQEFAYKTQIEWELEAMEKADIIMFWIPRELETMPAFTTNIEFGYWLAKEPSKIILGVPSYAVNCDYIKYLAKVNDIQVHTNKLETIKAVLRSLNEI